MFLTSSSPLRNAVLMSPEIRRYLCEATHCMIKASDAVGVCHEALRSDLDPESLTRCLCLSTRFPCQDPPCSHDSLLVNKCFLDQIEHPVIKPRLKLQLLCFSEKTSHFSLIDFHTFSPRSVHSKHIHHRAAIEQHLNVCHPLNHRGIQIIVFWKRALDRSPFSAKLLSLHEVAFPSSGSSCTRTSCFCRSVQTPVLASCFTCGPGS